MIFWVNLVSGGGQTGEDATEIELRTTDYPADTTNKIASPNAFSPVMNGS